MTSRPNLLIFNPDQWRGDVLGHMGNPAVHTPHLDAMAQTDGVSFRNAFCQNPVCTPSRCSFMTGWYPHTHGHRTMYHMIHEHEPLLLEELRKAGYTVFWAGKNDLVPGQSDHQETRASDIRYRCNEEDARRWGYELQPDLHSNADEWRGEKGGDTYYSFYAGKLETGEKDVYFDHDWADVTAAEEFIRDYDGEGPFCVFLSMSYPHPPYGVEEPWYSMTPRDGLPPRIPEPDWDTAKKPSLLKGIREGQQLGDWSEERWNELRATYYGMCSRADEQFGRIITALKETNRYDDTGIFFFSDHGDFTGDYSLVEKTQNTFEDCLTRVPLVVKPPAGQAVEPRVSEAMVELVDFSETVYDWAGIDPHYWRFGRSLRDVLAGETDELRDAVFCEGGRLEDEIHASERKSSSANGDTGLYSPRIACQTRIPEHTKAAMCRTRRYKYVRRLYETDELYDLDADPRELHNRIDDPTLADVLAELKDRMLRWYMETADIVPMDEDDR